MDFWEIVAVVIAGAALVVSGFAARYAKLAPQKESTLNIESRKRDDIRGHLNAGQRFVDDVKCYIDLRGEESIPKAGIPPRPKVVDLAPASELASELTIASKVATPMDAAYTSVLSLQNSWGVFMETLREHIELERKADIEKEMRRRVDPNDKGLPYVTGRDEVIRYLDEFERIVDRYEEAAATVRDVFSRADRGETPGWGERRKERREANRV